LPTFRIGLQDTRNESDYKPQYKTQMTNIHEF